MACNVLQEEARKLKFLVLPSGASWASGAELLALEVSLARICFEGCRDSEHLTVNAFKQAVKLPVGSMLSGGLL